MKLIIDIPKSRYNEIVSGIFDADSCFKINLTLAFRNGTPIPDNATNGDVIKAMFPNGTTAKFATFMRFIDGEHYFNCSEDWWNAPYQKGGKE